jgi:hypothetical protein
MKTVNHGLLEKQAMAHWMKRTRRTESSKPSTTKVRA